MEGRSRDPGDGVVFPELLDGEGFSSVSTVDGDLRVHQVEVGGGPGQGRRSVVKVKGGTYDVVERRVLLAVACESYPDRHLG